MNCLSICHSKIRCTCRFSLKVYVAIKDSIFFSVTFACSKRRLIKNIIWNVEQYTVAYNKHSLLPIYIWRLECSIIINESPVLSEGTILNLIATRDLIWIFIPIFAVQHVNGLLNFTNCPTVFLVYSFRGLLRYRESRLNLK